MEPWVKQDSNVEVLPDIKNPKQAIAAVAPSPGGKWRALISQGQKIYRNNPNDIRESILLPIFNKIEDAKNWAEIESQKLNVHLGEIIPAVVKEY
jgi:hypothetical protein